MEGTKPKIGFMGMSLELYRKNLPDSMKDFEQFSHKLKSVLEEIADVVHSPVICTREETENALGDFQKKGIEGVVLVFLSYSTSLSILAALRKHPFPLLIWNTQNLREISEAFSLRDLVSNHGMHGVQDLCSVLQREAVPFSLITGHFLDSKVRRKVNAWCRAAQVASYLKRMTIGRIGGTFEGMGDFSVEKEVLTQGLGPEVREIPFSYLKEMTERVSEKDVRESIVEDRKRFEIENRLEEETHYRSAKLELALREVVRRKSLNALAVNFSTFDPASGIEAVPFLGISKLLGEGLGYGGEGDIYAATAVSILQLLAGKANFVEMFTTDYQNSLILMNHMGESNPRMAKKDFPIKLVQGDPVLSNCLPTAVLSFTLEPGEVTLLNLKISSRKKLEFVLTGGEILDRPPFPDISSPHFIFKPKTKVEDFLTQYSLGGGTHHSALSYEDWSQEIEYLSNITGVPLLRV